VLDKGENSAIESTLNSTIVSYRKEREREREREKAMCIVTCNIAVWVTDCRQFSHSLTAQFNGQVT